MLSTLIFVIKAAVATVPKEITTISADKIKSVRIAPFTFSFSKVARSSSSLLNSFSAYSEVEAFLCIIV